MKEFPTLESEKSAPRVENIEIQITEEKKNVNYLLLKLTIALITAKFTNSEQAEQVFYNK